jgi:pyridoxamine 5'-phosphate oxidase
LASRDELETRWQMMADRYAGTTIPRPDFWGGYRLVPDRIEFWFNRDHRLHDRLLFVHEDGTWREHRLAP